MRLDNRPRGRWLSVVLRWHALAVALQTLAANPPDSADLSPRWFTLPLEVRGLKEPLEFVPVSTRIDFSDIVARLNISGIVDERSLRLYRFTENNREEIPYQFTATDQTRPQGQQLLAGTPPSVSYVAEYPAGQTPERIKVVGDLTWVARGNSTGVERYILRFALPRKGRSIQVPFSPQNLRAFDESGRTGSNRWFPTMQLHPQWPFEGQVQIFRNQQLLTAYSLGPSLRQLQQSGGVPAMRRPFFYPLYGPDGISLTEFGKPHDPTGSHAHHYSLWIAHFKVDGRDFWGERGGVIAHEQLEEMEDGPVFCRIVQKARWIDKGEELVRERRRITVYQTPEEFRLLDIELELSPTSAKSVTFEKTSFGFFAARVAQSMTVFDGGGEIRNANGDLNEHGAHLKRAAWIDQSGPIASGKWGGLAILDHPGNLNHPTGWHCRNDGWAGAAFNMESPFTLEPSAKLRLRYRIHLHRHDAILGRVAQRFEEFAAKPLIFLGVAKLEE
jgi:hypothetical protein